MVFRFQVDEEARGDLPKVDTNAGSFVDYQLKLYP